MPNSVGQFGESTAPSDARWARRFLLAATVVTAALYTLPYGWYAAYPLVLLSTYVHEVAHGLAALLVGGRFDFLTIHADGSGLASISAGGGRVASAFIAGAGLVGPAIGGAVLLILAARPKLARAGLVVFATLSVVALIAVVRNAFGWGFVGLVAAGCGVVAWRGGGRTAQAVSAFLGVQLALSVFSRADYLFTAVATTGSGTHPSDVANMAEALWFPYWFWGGLCAVLSVAALVSGYRVFLSLTRPPVPDPSA
jgi:hypothetical protein